MTPIKIYNSLLTELATFSAVISATRSERINSENTLTFSALIKDAKSVYINDTNIAGLGDDRFDIAFYKKEQRSDGQQLVTVECEHVSYRLNSSDYDLDYFNMTDTPTNILTALLDGTDFTVGTVDFTDSVTFDATLTGAATGGKFSRRSLLMQFVAQLGGELECSAFSISILTARGSATPKTLTVGKDVATLSKAVDKRKLDDSGNPVVVYTVGVYKAAALALGDVVSIEYSPLDVNTELRIVSIAYDPYNPNSVSIEVGNYAGRIEDVIYSVMATKASVTKLNSLEAATLALNQLISNSFGYYTTTVTDPYNGAKTTYIHDESTLAASTVIYVITSGGLAWTDQGWNGGSPTWQYGITAEGNVVAKVLNVIGVVADWIRSGKLTSADGSAEIDLDSNSIKHIVTVGGKVIEVRQDGTDPIAIYVDNVKMFGVDSAGRVFATSISNVDDDDYYMTYGVVDSKTGLVMYAPGNKFFSISGTSTGYVWFHDKNDKQRMKFYPDGSLEFYDENGYLLFWHDSTSHFTRIYSGESGNHSLIGVSPSGPHFSFGGNTVYLQNIPPIGTISMWPTVNAPYGYKICDGSAISRTTYANLFAVIGTTFGTGDGSTTFNLPNFASHVPVGIDSSDTNINNVGDKYGEKTHTLITNEIPAHTHPINSSLGQTPTTYVGTDTGYAGINPNTGNQLYPYAAQTAGGGLAHNNMQPSMAVYFIIKY